MVTKLFFMVARLGGQMPPEPVDFPGVRREGNVVWHLVQFSNGRRVFSASAGDAGISVAFTTGDDARLWKFEGDAGRFAGGR